MKRQPVIICVDDERIVLDSLASVLSRHFGRDFELEFAESAQEALEIIEELEEENSPVYAIITDWLMPHMKGDELLFRVRNKYASIKTIMLSGQVDPAALARAKEQETMDFFLSKPWDEQELVTKISA